MINRASIENINKLLQEAILQFNRRNTEDSREKFYQVLEEDPTNPEANYYLGLIYSKEDNSQKAVLHLKAVVDLSVNFLYTQQCRMLLGIIYFKNQEYKRAELEYLEVLKSKVNIVQVYAALAAIKYYMNDQIEALQYAKKACDIDVYNLNAKNTYAFFLCDYDLDIDKGLDMLKEVTRLKPGNPAYLDSLGWAYFKKGDKKNAVENLKKALELADNIEIQEHLSIVNRSL